MSKRQTKRPQPRSPASPPTALTRLLDGAPVMVMALDGRGGIVAWNRSCERVTGYGLADLQGAGWKKLFADAEGRRRFRTETARRLHRPFRNWRWQVTTADQAVRHLQWHSVSGTPPYADAVRWAFGIDVTRQEADRSSLQITSEFLRIAQQTARFGAWSFDPAAGTVNFTPELEAIYGVPRGRFGRRYRDFADRVFPEDLARIEPIRQRAVRRREPFEYDIRVRGADGGTRWINVRGRGLYGANGRLLRIVGIDSDVTERVETRRSLAEKSAYLDAILRSQEVLVFHQDRDLRYTAVLNPALGMESSHARGKTDEELLGKEIAAPLQAPKRRVLRTGRGERMEVAIARDGRTGWFDLIIEPARDDEGRITGIVCAAIDVTARHAAQRELETANTRLQELASHLQESIEAERGAVARDVHDQVGATLTAIRMRLTTLAGRVQPELPSLRAELLSVAALTESAMHATRDICSRLRPPSLEDIGLAETCRWYLADWSQATRIRSTARFPRSDCEVGRAAATDVFRIFQELLTNVARHSKASCVQATLACSHRHLRLTVSDDGHGFAGGAAEGFGLAGVRERARHHGGRVSIRTSAQGTKIDVIIPAGGAP